jgi:hypothetical protein
MKKSHLQITPYKLHYFTNNNIQIKVPIFITNNYVMGDLPCIEVNWNHLLLLVEIWPKENEFLNTRKWCQSLPQIMQPVWQKEHTLLKHQLMQCTFSLVTQSVGKQTTHITISLQYDPNKSLTSYCEMVMYDVPINHNHMPLLL